MGVTRDGTERPTGTVVVTGAGGLLGREVVRVFASGGAVVPLGRADLDVSDERAVRETIARARPSLVVHCAAWADVDACESDPDRAFAVNAYGAGHVARACAEAGAGLVAISTDYVFDGRKGTPYTEDDEPNPVQAYGRSKLAGEELVRSSAERHYIVRPAWIYGPNGRNYLCRIPDMVLRGETIRAVTNQRGCPTYAPDLAEAIVRLVGRGEPGTYHVTNRGACSPVEFCEAVASELGADARVEGVRLGELGRPAPRPDDTTLDGTRWVRAGLEPLRGWRDAVGSFCRAVRLARSA